MYLPPSYMNYAAPVQTVQYVSQGPPPQRTVYNPYVTQYVAQPQPQPVPVRAAPQRSTGLCRNFGYIVHPLGLLRFLLIASTLGTLISSALVRKTNISGVKYDYGIYISTLTFACVGLATCLLIYALNLLNVVWAAGCRLVPWTVLFALFDLAWSVANIVLGSFCAARENRHQRDGDFDAFGLRRGAFGAAAAFALLSGVLFFWSAVVGLIFGLRWLKEQRALNQAARGVVRR